MKNEELNIKQKPERKWHALYVNSRAEKKVMETLQSKGIVAYVPLVKTMKQWRDRKKMVEFPLMNGYGFLNIIPSENELTLQTRGVVSFVRSEKKIAIVREVEIERLKQLIELGYQMESGLTRRSYEEGDKVKITSGALKNIEGFVVRNEQGRFIDVLLESIGQSIRVKLPEEILIPSTAHA